MDSQGEEEGGRQIKTLAECGREEGFENGQQIADVIY